jgi:hypothetical protein
LQITPSSPEGRTNLDVYQKKILSNTKERELEEYIKTIKILEKLVRKSLKLNRIHRPIILTININKDNFNWLIKKKNNSISTLKSY